MHTLDEVAPVAVANVPAGHEVHVVDEVATPVLYVPAGHTVLVAGVGQ